jgi:hypothetical protein
MMLDVSQTDFCRVYEQRVSQEHDYIDSSTVMTKEYPKPYGQLWKMWYTRVQTVSYG